LRHVAGERYGLAACSVDESDGFAGGLRDEIGDGDARPLTRKGESGGTSDATAPPVISADFPSNPAIAFLRDRLRFIMAQLRAFRIRRRSSGAPRRSW
jgi:hypothetical protein